MRIRLVVVEYGRVIKEQITTTDWFIKKYTNMTKEEKKELEKEIKEKGYTYFEIDTCLIYLYEE